LELWIKSQIILHMQQKKQDEEKPEKCPYNPNHIMPKERLLWHISSGCQDKVHIKHDFAKSYKLENVWPPL